ncbi:MAG: anaerobic ribonucleoside-triphosphate reductase [Bacilli bacterium]|nr:anaerobic ribonucleoside-triphosphate reductase [Bacilli bacterium]
MVEKKKPLDTLIVVKRSGQRTEFNGEKIALAIKKAFDSALTVYDPESANKVYGKVLEKLEKEYQDRKTIKIEDIQDKIEEQLKKSNYIDVYESFSNYRIKRSLSRETFALKQQHKFLKAIESLGLSSLKEGGTPLALEEQSPAEVIYNFGVTISKEFAKAYLLDNKFVRAMDSGMIHIHGLEFLSMGTTSTIQVELEKLFKNGFSLGYGNKSMPSDIYEYANKAAFVIEAAENNQHGSAVIGAFDYAMAPGVLKTFKKIFKKQVHELLLYEDIFEFVNIERVGKEIDKMDSLSISLSTFDFAYRNSKKIYHLFDEAYENAVMETKEDVRKAMLYFIESLNAVYAKAKPRDYLSTICFGTDTSLEGHMISESILDVLDMLNKEGKTVIRPVSIFKVKEGINFTKEDMLYSLYEKAVNTALYTGLVRFSFLDSPPNKKMYKKTDYTSEVTYTEKGERTAEDGTSVDVQTSGGKGNISATSLNLPRLAIKYGICTKERETADMKGFYKELEEYLDIVKDQLLERFEIQCSKHNYNFPFLIGQGVWKDGEKAKDTDRLRKILKHGNLTIHFVGLAEALTALIGKHHGQSEEALELGLEIVTFMKKKTDIYTERNNLNFALSGVNYKQENERFINIDKAIYGKIKDVTDGESYTESFHIPMKKKISEKERIEKEAPFHTLTNGGHIFYYNGKREIKECMDTLSHMKGSGIGYTKV